MSNVQFPSFKLIQEKAEAITRDVPTTFSGEMNGDKVLDKVEIIQKGNQIGFRLGLGTYNTKKVNSLFGTVAELDYVSKVIWEVPPDADTEFIRIENFEVRDVNNDGDLDIRFTARQRMKSGTEIAGVYILMNQTVLDPELATLEPGGKQPQPKIKPVPTDGGEKKGPPSERDKKVGQLSLVF